MEKYSTYQIWINGLRKGLLYYYLFVYALYLYLNKGIAYSFLAESVLVVGLLLILLSLKQLQLIWNKPILIVSIFFIASLLAILFSIGKYPLTAILQDASMFLYLGFVLVIFLFQDDWDFFIKKLITLYAWYPLVAFCSYQLSANWIDFREFVLFGNVPLALVKYGDMAIHLLIISLLLAAGYIRFRLPILVINALLIFYLVLLIATYTRGGLLAYLLPFLIFVYAKRKELAAVINRKTIVVALGCIIAAVFLYLNSNDEPNFQGRAIGFDQLSKNLNSVFSVQEEGALTDNKLWRLAWWYKLFSDALDPVRGLVGVGVGPSLTLLGDVGTDDELLRSPHSFHLSILARFGIPIFLLWIFWMWLHFSKIRSAKKESFAFLILLSILGFIINASFDVYLEGPMGAFAFWTWVGVLYVNDLKS